ncbi:MAG: tetratricopeptide repeat protein [Acidobacteria bacterium]|nr:tetratricopeptide repeat protein [Acidobacteriota bacterium]
MSKLLCFLLLGVLCILSSSTQICAQVSNQIEQEWKRIQDQAREKRWEEERIQQSKIWDQMDLESKRAAQAKRLKETQWYNAIIAAQYAIQQGNYTDAERILLAAAKIAESFGKKDPRLADSLNDLARVYSAKNRYKAAEPLYKRALKIMEEAYGPEDSTVGASLNNLAILQFRMGNYTEAESLFKRSLSVIEKSLGPEHPTVAVVLENYAALLQKTNQDVDMEEMKARAAAIFENADRRETVHEEHVRENPELHSLLEAAMIGNSKSVKTLLTNKAIVNAKDEEGWTPLMTAAAFGQTDVVKILLKAGADVNARDAKGATAMNKAQESGYTNVVKILKKAGAEE